MNPWLILFTIPTLLQGWLVGLLSLTVGISRYPSVERGVLVTYWRPWVARRWHYSTTIGAWMGMHPEHGGRTEYHELIHVQQYEDLNLLGAALGGLLCIVSWRTGLIVWASSGPLWLLPNFIGGLARYGSAYYGASHERSAYCITAIEADRDGRPWGL